MKKESFREYLLVKNDNPNSTHTILSRLTTIEKKRNINLDDIVISDKLTYELLKNTNKCYHFAIRKYYQYINKIRFYRLSNYEKIHINGGEAK